MSALRVERDADILRVTLARPERRNAFDAALIAELAQAFADVGDARAVSSVREAKRLVLEPADEDDAVARAAARRTSVQGQEGLRAFLEKRHPGWRQ
jgi:enoyl-CoA hydratase/carnithine racemase